MTDKSWRHLQPVQTETKGSVTGNWAKYLQWVLHLPEKTARRRMASFLGEAQLARMDVGGRSVPAVKHRLTAEPVICLTVLCVAWVATLFSPVAIALCLPIAHAIGVFTRETMHQHRFLSFMAFPVAAFEVLFAAGLYGKSPILLTLYLLFFYIPGFAFLIVLTWRMDIEFVTTDNRLIRSAGIGIYRRSFPIPLKSLRSADVYGPYFWTRIGRIFPNTPLDKDRFLAMWILNPNQWSTYITPQV